MARRGDGIKPPTTWGPSDRSAIVAFERYFSWADTMRQHVDDLFDPDPCTHWEPYMAYWYGGLYAVTEGWRALRFRDAQIAAMLKDKDKMAFLGGYRNAVFHFEREYFDTRVVAVWEREDVIEWAGWLHRQVGRWIREELPKIVASTFPQGGG